MPLDSDPKVTRRCQSESLPCSPSNPVRRNGIPSDVNLTVSNHWTRGLVAAAWVIAGAGGLHAQAPADTLGEARRLRDAGEFRAAATLLRPYVQAHPDDPGSARFAALMSYWAKDARTADSIYSAALSRHPNDVELRLEYARLLVDTRSDARAHDVLAPLTAPPTASSSNGGAGSPAARANALLGTLAYWNGDLTTARRWFGDALRLDPSLQDARRQLLEIETATASWIRVGASGWDDDQPLQHTTGAVEGGWFVNPLTPLTIHTRAIRYDGHALGETVMIAEGALSTYVPRARLDLGIAAGMVQRSFGDGSDWTGRLSLGVRVPASGVLEVSGERAPYLNTTGSLATPIMVDAVQGAARFRPRGWMIEGVARREQYPDDNDVTTGYAWALAPILRRARGTVHAGYSIAAQSASSGRFIPRSASLSFPPGQAPPTVPGKYDPYYTPRNLRVHSALASVRLVPNARFTVTSDVSYGFSAREDAPVLVVVPSPPDLDVVRAYYERSFTPWSFRAAADIGATDAFRLGLTVEHGRRVFYRFTTVGLTGTYTFVAAARRRADRR